MPVATLTEYEEMWTHPQVVAALSNGLFTYTAVEPWNATVPYKAGDVVLAGDACPYGGCVYRALEDNTGVDPVDSASCAAWVLDEVATIERLRLYTATCQATWLLDALSGYRLHGYECWAEDYVVHLSEIKLRRGPVAQVRSVQSVHRCNQPGGEWPNWCHISTDRVSLCCNGGQNTALGYLDVGYYYGGYSQAGTGLGCGCRRDAVRVHYDISSTLPPGTEGLVCWLAGEYGKAAAGLACALPERITNITRQGISWTVLDPQEFLTKGYSGMSKVDNWLSPVKLTLGGTILDPLLSHRLRGERGDCNTVVNPL